MRTSALIDTGNDALMVEMNIRSICNASFPRNTIGELYAMNGLLEKEVRSMYASGAHYDDIMMKLTTELEDYNE